MQKMESPSSSSCKETNVYLAAAVWCINEVKRKKCIYDEMRRFSPQMVFLQKCHISYTELVRDVTPDNATITGRQARQFRWPVSVTFIKATGRGSSVMH